MPGKFHAEPAHIHALLAQFGNFFQCADRVLIRNGIADFKEVTAIRHTGHAAHKILIHRVGYAGTGVKDGECITHGAIRKAANQFRRAAVQLNLFLPGNIFEPVRNFCRCDALKIIALAAAQDGGGDSLHFGGGKDKDDVLGRLLHCLEQRVERLRREHMHLIDDIHLIPANRREICHLVTQVADVIHTAVGGSIHLNNIQHGAGVNSLADFTFPARVGFGSIEAVDRFGKDFGAGRLAGTARSGEQVGMADASRRNLVFQCGDNRFLADHVGEFLRPPFTVQRTVHFAHLPFWHSRPHFLCDTATKRTGSARGVPRGCAALHTDAG